MATAADVAFLDNALAQLEGVRRWTPRTISKLEALISSDDPWDVYRVDPPTFAAEKGISEQEAIDLFLHASHLGVFHMEWRLVCPLCTDTVSSCKSMSTVRSRCYCQLCQRSVEVNLDDFIAVSFNLSPRVREMPWHKPESLSVEELMLRYRIDRRAMLPGLGPFGEVIRQFSRLAEYLEPGDTRTVEAEMPPGWAAVLFDASASHTVILPVRESGRAAVQANLSDEGWQVEADSIAPGKVSITVNNRASRRVPIVLMTRPDDEDDDKGSGVQMGPFLNGNRLLNNQTFRTLFRAETLATGEGVGVRDLTLLFTDLKGSTELYERVGDLSAFALVQQHFEHLRRAVMEQDGAVVKTIGDAVMASFVKPEQAVKAALSMFREIEQFNQHRGTRDLILKVGAHRGHSIAVTLNDRLDYFGQTVNIASRVQSAAAADELCLTDDMYSDPGVQQALEGREAVREMAQLKGIAATVPIRRIPIRQNPRP
ncbi:MAG: adenylate/guanylate cyclase domain-containing protein [Planctomycetes bacterium]|nr:adenylate/guanylate cyclase domain-containing protein [Planctomycetota bacterium]MCW8134186.1 adenylate/guanylate cyclase domain-containing protein [Planctomycetota bacterium]